MKNKKNTIKSDVMGCFPTLKERGQAEKKHQEKFKHFPSTASTSLNQGFLAGYNWAKREFKKRLETLEVMKEVDKTKD